jgi:plastocyanin
MQSKTLNRHVVSLAAALVLVLCSLGPGAAACSRKPVTYTVTIDASRFEPASLTVTAGDTVVWINKDIIPHTATSQTGAFDSGELPLGQSWTYRPTQVGEFAYVCAFHPTMKATLLVK